MKIEQALGQDLEAFKRNYWEPNAPGIFTADADFREYFDEAADSSAPEKLLREYDGKVSVLHRQYGALDLAPDGALERYNEGWTVYLRGAEACMPEASDVLDSVADAFGFRRGFLSVEIFMSKLDSGVPMHADYDINFAYLVKGMKEWRLSEPTIPNSPTVVLPRGAKQTEDVEAVSDRASLYESMPENHQTFLAQAGNTLFLPRSWWHETTASGECFQINFVVKGQQLLDFVLQGIRAELLGEKDAREFITGVNTTAGRDKLAEKLAKLLSRLGGSPEEIARQLLDGTTL